jgi:glycosyltransferase involved in cell wall biosynthesis
MPIDALSHYPLKVVPGRIGLTSRIDDRRKNVELFIESIALCRERGLEVTGILVGGTLSERARKLVDRYKLGQVLKVLPFVPREQLPSLLQTFDIYLLPSKQEGLCIAALEAMACGCPVISTRCGGPEEFVQNGKTGYLVDFDAEEIAMRIEQVFRNRQLRSQLSEYALHLIKENYSTDRVEDVFWRAFEETFSRRIW